ncbi:Lrp/AsnC family transcriptional regulator [Paenibacillus taiwanensis]|uniref:Lrp/AsnC family transcriptional regulator n=1 Tax=Paenibacillus taiwanensis TaxID=401638 RepID=UPI000402F4CA|nr:Lrp/AsnC family transcriptional regulator [Paenibacillus taiwanensis]
MLDHTDKQILAELKQNGRISMKELGLKIHMTGQATANRVSKLEEEGIIKQYTVLLDDPKVGYPVHTFINIYTKDFDHRPYLSFIASQSSHVIANYKISGEGCYMLECKFASNEHLDDFLVALNRFVNYKLSMVINKSG